jgi:hypothetical protein
MRDGARGITDRDKGFGGATGPLGVMTLVLA